MHVSTCRGELCPRNHANYFNQVLSAGLPPPLERDCGQWCSAFTFLDKTLPMVRMTFPDYDANLAFVYDASPEVWGKMMCAAVTDSSATTRSCCTCYETRFCPFYEGGSLTRTDSGYCNAGHCAANDENCKQLAAGCGVSVWAAWDESQWHTCSEADIATAKSDMCKQPLWCDDGANTFGWSPGIKDAEAWWREFGYADGRGNGITNGDWWWDRQFFGARQCMWKRSQKQQFVDTVRKAASVYKVQGYSRDEPGLWNEVNMYYGPDDTETAAVMWRNLIGLVYIRDGIPIDKTRLFQLRDHFRQLGREVPIFKLGMERWGDLDNWDLHTNIDLTADPFSLELLEE